MPKLRPNKKKAVERWLEDSVKWNELIDEQIAGIERVFAASGVVALREFANPERTDSR